MSELRSDIAVVGGGLGGVAAALAAARHGHRVVLTEPTDWLGGQMTTQAVPPDEHPWIEQFGCTATYRRLRDEIRATYKRWYPLRLRALQDPYLNPGGGKVGPLCHEPRVALSVLEGMLAPYRASGRLTVLFEHVPDTAEVERDVVRAVTLRDTRTGERTTVQADYVLDATETGELLPRTGTEYVSGFESAADTGEPSAPSEAQPLNMQAVSWCFVIEHRAGEDHTIPRPEGYEAWRDHQPPVWPDKQFSWTAPHPHTLEPRTYGFGPNPDDDPLAVRANQAEDPGSADLWLFRRIAARNVFEQGFYDSDLVVVNWPQIDYLGGPLYEVDEAAAADHADRARQMSRCFLHWLQTEAPRPDGGTGWPGLRARGDVLGTDDGLAKAPYYRESRRLRAMTTVREQDIAVAVRGDAGSITYPDSVGIGAYRIDLHPSVGGDNYIDVPAHPYQIPLGALLPVRVRNLLAAAKNIGTTHITNGCYRVHPAEWNVGEAAGLLAAHCLEADVEPGAVHAKPDELAAYQARLRRDGVELDWPAITPW